ncbi:transcriptional regulator [Flavobacterium circumlabens]|uniref:Transcriptional regulator n=1 Tax=Flavobacterium circumlabens TaxID=2133765 RepID=A0A4Y7UHK2_9FLAO|nr:transcriptional regulator [Flavobacterium circumlabens]TCN60700.1 HTH-type transcriptional regulator/antitoxin HigA [Flavobacterium circumlabens]TEB45846.1 transcriptional regulator [Flavobacterium circumlabens]
MKINAIRTEKEYDLALERVNAIFDAKPDTNESKELEELVTLIEKYEEIHYPIPEPNQDQ